jgi:hypothetical protein
LNHGKKLGWVETKIRLLKGDFSAGVITHKKFKPLELLTKEMNS